MQAQALKKPVREWMGRVGLAGALILGSNSHLQDPSRMLDIAGSQLALLYHSYSLKVEFSCNSAIIYVLVAISASGYEAGDAEDIYFSAAACHDLQMASTPPCFLSQSRKELVPFKPPFSKKKKKKRPRNLQSLRYTFVTAKAIQRNLSFPYFDSASARPAEQFSWFSGCVTYHHAELDEVSR